IFGSSTASPYIGQRLVSVLPETAALRRFGNSGLIQTYIGDEPHYAAIQPVGQDGGLIIAARSLASINYFWRHEVSLNVTLFACISAILLVILYAYYMQVKRAREADETFLEANLRIETALARGR